VCSNFSIYFLPCARRGNKKRGAGIERSTFGINAPTTATRHFFFSSPELWQQFELLFCHQTLRHASR